MLTRSDALSILTRCRIEVGADFFTLSSTQLEALLEVAHERHYSKPPQAPGSTARHFYAYVDRRAADREWSGFVSRTDQGRGRMPLS